MSTCDCCKQDYEELNDLLGYCDECSVLINACEDAVSIARRVGVPLYGPTSWRKATDHLEHASRHVYRERIKNNPGIIPDEEDHIAHAICRLVMAKALQDG